MELLGVQHLESPPKRRSSIKSKISNLGKRLSQIRSSSAEYITRETSPLPPSFQYDDDDVDSTHHLLFAALRNQQRRHSCFTNAEELNRATGLKPILQDRARRHSYYGESSKDSEFDHLHFYEDAYCKRRSSMEAVNVQLQTSADSRSRKDSFLSCSSDSSSKAGCRRDTGYDSMLEDMKLSVAKSSRSSSIGSERRLSSEDSPVFEIKVSNPDGKTSSSEDICFFYADFSRDKMRKSFDNNAYADADEIALSSSRFALDKIPSVEIEDMSQTNDGNVKVIYVYRESSVGGSRIERTMSDAAVQVGINPHSTNNNATPSRCANDERISGLEEKLNSNSIAEEYESLPMKKHPLDCRVALHSDNVPRNRFPNVLPYEDTRVRLMATNSNPHGYINANHIKMKVGKEKLTYIVTQNPLVDTVMDFWQMIWQHKVSIITMVTELEERGAQKCPRYWPVATGLQNAVTVNDLRITLKHSAVSPNFTTSCLKVLKTSTKESMTLWHIQHTDWQQIGCPKDVHGFLELLNEIDSVRLHIQSETGVTSPCMAVHCSTGVGRSGVVILSDVMRKCLENNEEISVSSILRELRNQRMYMVQTLAQYKFVHEVLIHYLKGVRLI